MVSPYFIPVAQSVRGRVRMRHRLQCLLVIEPLLLQLHADVGDRGQLAIIDDNQIVVLTGWRLTLRGRPQISQPPLKLFVFGSFDDAKISHIWHVDAKAHVLLLLFY